MSLTIALEPGAGPRRPGQLVSCAVRFGPERYSGARAQLAVVVQSTAGTVRYYQGRRASESFAPDRTVTASHLELPNAASARVSAALFPEQTSAERRASPADPIAGWEAPAVEVSLVDDAGTAGAAPVGLLPRTVDSVFDLIRDRDPAGAVVDGAGAAFEYVAAGLAVDLAPVIRAAYRPYPDEIGPDGRRLTAAELEPWQRWLIQYMTGSYYSAAYRVAAALQAGVGYPIGVECDTMSDTSYWARGLVLAEDAPDAPGLTGGRARSLYQRLGRRAGARYDEVSEHAPLDLRTLRPGSLLVYDGHIDTVLRVRHTREGRGGVTYQLFDTGGVIGRPQDRAYPTLLGRWSGCMKEEPWRIDVPRYGEDPAHPVNGHLWVPPPERPRTAFPRTAFCVPPGAVEGVTAATRFAPTARLCLVDRSTGGVAYRSSELPLRVPLTQLLYSVSALPNSAAWEARWLVDAGRYGNHGSPGRGALLIDIYNDAQGVARQWRPAYGVTGASRRAEYLELPRHEPDRPVEERRRLEAELDGATPADERDRRLKALVSSHAPGSTVDLA